jgi:hypothetical protein
MLPLSDGGYVKTLREQWLQTSDDSSLDYPNAIASYCAYELKSTVWHVLIVPELSATYLCNRTTHSVITDHIGIVKPKDKRDDSYVFFKAAYERTFGPRGAAISQTLATATLTSLDDRVPVFANQNAIFTQSKATSKYIDVGCEETREGELNSLIKLGPNERITGVQPIIANAVNVRSSWAAVVRHDSGGAVVHYAIRGLDRQAFNCPGGGHADVVVNYLIEAR